jgi:ubiquitin-conjugating enzyme E2 D/E
LEAISAGGTDFEGWSAGPVDDDIFHWRATIFNFDATSANCATTRGQQFNETFLWRAMERDDVRRSTPVQTQVLTVTIQEISSKLHVSCTRLSGELLPSLLSEMEKDATVGHLRQQLAQLLGCRDMTFFDEAANEAKASSALIDFQDLTVKVCGPETHLNPYAGGAFYLDILFPSDYPFKPPRVTFATKIYHCNLKLDGLIHTPMLGKEWSPAMGISYVLSKIHGLIKVPDPHGELFSIIDDSIAEKYVTSREEHDSIAREWTRKFAM